MKKVIFFTMVFCLLAFGFYGCSQKEVHEDSATIISNDKYTLLKSPDGTFSMIFPESKTPAHDNSGTQVNEMLYVPVFSSVEEMKSKLLSGDIPEQQIEGLRHISAGTSNVLKIANPEAFCEATLPDDMEVSEIYFYGTYYTQNVQSETGINGYVEEVETVQAFKEIIKEGYPLGLGENTEILSVQHIKDRNAQVTTYHLQNGYHTLVSYEIHQDNATTYVVEHYDGNYDYSDVFTSSESDPIPSTIRFFKEEHGLYLKGFLYSLPSRPSVEWLSSFGLTPYVEE